MKKNDIRLPILIKGGLATDERGTVSFVNEFNFAQIKRFYKVTNHRAGTVRAWHGHKHEAKYVYVVSGSAFVGAVAIDDWKHPSRDAKVYHFSLSSSKPSILYIPEGYANGFMSTTDDAALLFFSSKTLEQSLKDDIRFDARYWDIWENAKKYTT